MKIIKIGLIALALLFTSNKPFASTPKEVFIAQGCNNCHTVLVEKIPHKEGSDEKSKDLSKVGLDHDKKWFAGWLLKKNEVNGEKHKKSFTGTTEELKLISTWLEGLK